MDFFFIQISLVEAIL